MPAASTVIWSTWIMDFSSKIWRRSASVLRKIPIGECLEMTTWHEDGLETCLHKWRWFLEFKWNDNKGIRSNKVAEEIVMKSVLEQGLVLIREPKRSCAIFAMVANEWVSFLPKGFGTWFLILIPMFFGGQVNKDVFFFSIMVVVCKLNLPHNHQLKGLKKGAETSPCSKSHKNIARRSWNKMGLNLGGPLSNPFVPH